ncbi:HAUS augmin-like complex subunit 4 isoform X1 [Coturnix japonica]|uniref:HAUS augmin-like complex subunit 4 isoform X1 n=1 Tax=Coturnix japonica TaxID=93934 RepID=UPI000776C136|nr:HAUS augmin-like complex subunit 4 isoform X1 [Coturnix japonica]
MEPEVLHAAPRWPRPLLAKLRLHPGLSQLAAALEEKGPIPNKGPDLDQWEAELARSRAAWLAEEVLWAGLKELLRKPRPPEAEKTLKAVEEAISLAELRRAAPPLAELMPRPPSHSSCVSLLLSLVSVRCRRRRVELRRHLYLQAKATAMLLKARLEELTLLLDTYSPEHVEAHGNIRSLLEAALSGSQLELASLRVTLGSYESLGPVMADAAQQYRDLRDRIHKPPLGPTAHGPHGDPPMRGSDVPIGCCGQTWLPIGCL